MSAEMGVANEEERSDVTDIRQVLEQIDVAWNVHDASKFAALFTGDARFTNVRGMQARGRDGVERFVAPLFATMFSDSEQHTLRIDTAFLAPGLAAVDAWWTMHGARTLDGSPRPTRYGLFSLVMRTTTEGWRIAVWHNMELAGLPPEDPAAWRFVIFHNEGPTKAH
ncbi:MAG TPA: SgcJ/EcaC family oxidoreductase [Actinomycetota bacterium]|nr:SgcJ/EcaC family oxidoreductase [Actinomycetota bacterium]